MANPTEPERDSPLVILTGGPGGGKTSVAERLADRLGGRLVLLPETATLLYSTGYPRGADPESRRAGQLTIAHLQRNRERVYAASHPGQALICDRGTVDGAAYWPDGPTSFFDELGTTHHAEVTRYTAVVFCETAARGGHGIGDGNPTRLEDAGEAIALDDALLGLWGDHPRFHHVGHRPTLEQKVAEVEALLLDLLARLSGPEAVGL